MGKRVGRTFSESIVDLLRCDTHCWLRIKSKDKVLPDANQYFSNLYQNNRYRFVWCPLYHSGLSCILPITQARHISFTCSCLIVPASPRLSSWKSLKPQVCYLTVGRAACLKTPTDPVYFSISLHFKSGCYKTPSELIPSVIRVAVFIMFVHQRLWWSFRFYLAWWQTLATCADIWIIFISYAILK